jgi:RNA polymerase sigma factor (sigma-70 family)
MPAAQAVEALSHEYGKLVFHTIYALTGDWEESQDLTQDTFHQALRSIDAARVTSGEHFHARAWLLSIALNTVRMQRRRRAIFRFIPFSHILEGKQHETDIDTLSDQAAPVQPGGYARSETKDPAELIAEQDAVQRTMSRLTESFRVCLLLSIVGGLSISEIARILDLKEPAVRQRLARARKQFQHLYAQESGEELFEAASVAHGPNRTQTQDAAEELNDKRLRLTAHPSLPGRNYV